MKNVSLVSVGQTCNISMEDLSLYKNLLSQDVKKFIARTIPSGQVFSNLKKPDVSLNIYNKERNAIEETYPNFNVYGKNINSMDVIALADYLLERKREESDIFNLHASAVSREDSCIVISGPSKSGKTVIPMNLRDRESLRYLTNERALINLEQGVLVGGCKQLEISGYHKEMFSKIEASDNISLGSLDFSHYNIKGIVYPNIDSGQKGIKIEEWTLSKAEWLLYPEFSSKIRGVNKRMFNFSYPLDSLDTKELAIKRIIHLKKFLEKTPFYFVKGNLEDICNFVESEL